MQLTLSHVYGLLFNRINKAIDPVSYFMKIVRINQFCLVFFKKRRVLFRL